MRVALLFPIRNYEKKIPEITLELNNKIHKDLTILGANHIDVRFPGLDYSYVATNESKENSPKGRCILDALKNMPQTPNFVIICDGSGKIPYGYISEIFQELISNSAISCVMAHRVRHKAIDGFRDRKSTRLNSSHMSISYAVFCLKKMNYIHICIMYAAFCVITTHGSASRWSS